MSRPFWNDTAAASRIRTTLGLLLLCSGAFAEVAVTAEKNGDHALPLPRWSEQELKAFRGIFPPTATHGEGLSKNDGAQTDFNDLIQTPLPSGPRLDHFFDNSELSPRLRAEDIRLFLPESVLSLPVQSQSISAHLPTPVAALQDVSPEFLAICMQSLAKEYLIDPDHLVPEIQQHDMLRLLEFHAQDARIKLYVLILDHDQQLPEGAALEKIASGSLLQSDACLLVYPLGEPWRSRLFVSSSIHNQISTDFLSETIQACLQESLQSSNVHDQLRSYTIQLSTRLFWLQRALGGSLANEADPGKALAEFSPQVKTAAAPSNIHLRTVVIWSTACLVLLGVVGIATRHLLHHQRLRRQRRIWMLPEPDTIPRLGGAFTGGGGGMIRYG